MNLYELGWNDIRNAEFIPFKEQGYLPGRVASAGGYCNDIFIDGDCVRSVLSGRFRYEALRPADYPATGDWVALRQESGQYVVEAVLQRHTVFSRRMTGRRTDEQVIAANIDTLCVVASLDGGRGFTLRGIERYLVLAREGGTVPLVLLNKADLCGDVPAALNLAGSSAPGAGILAVSAITGEGLDSLREYLLPGHSVAFTGPSGVGKSSLVNALMNEASLRTTPVREGDLRGRHTTTRGEMFPLPWGALVIDTPGLREVSLCAAESGLDAEFPEIIMAAERCRFRNCSHTGEPGCAVADEIEQGLIDHGRYIGYLGMKRELEYLESRNDFDAGRERKMKEKKFSRMVREYKKDR